MIAAPWTLPLSATFLVTAAFYMSHLTGAADHTAASHVRAMWPPPRSWSWSLDTLVHGSHLIMSLAMLLMVWQPIGTVATGAQVALFTLLTVPMLLGFPKTQGAVERVGIISHIVLNSAMVWMLLAMPLLMTRPTSTTDGGHSHHDHGSIGTLTASNWVATTNAAVVVLSTLIALWWAARLLLGRDRRNWPNTTCHMLMAAGMALMLAVM